jgi:U-box domain
LFIIIISDEYYARGISVGQSASDSHRLPPSFSSLRFAQEDIDAAYARGISVGLSSSTDPVPCLNQEVISGGVDAAKFNIALEGLLTCPIGLDLLEDPVVNHRSGLTYSRRNMQTWLLQNPTDPQTRADTTIDDLVDNILVRQILELYQTQ